MIAPLPELTSIRATITPPKDLGLEQYTEDVEQETLTVIQHAQVELTLTLTQPMSSGQMIGLGDEALAMSPGAEHELTITFDADEAQDLTFAITSRLGLSNSSLPALHLNISFDKDPTFTYESPGSDYLATNVASIPLEMTISDDFGITEAALVYEIEGQDPVRIPASINGSAKSVTIQHTLELEDMNLEVGDTILVYAEVRDQSSHLKKTAELTNSPLHFIEIKAYHQLIHPPSLSMPSSGGPQGLKGERLPTLMNLLEYSRAVMKKVWDLKGKTPLDDELQEKADAIGSDSEFIADKIGKVLIALQKKLTEKQYDDLSEVRTAYRDIATQLHKYQSEEALMPAKTAYRRMRELVDELEKVIPPSGGAPPKDGLEKIKLEEKVHLTRFEDDQVQWELDKLAKKLAAAEAQQKELEKRFRQLLGKQRKQEGHQQAITNNESNTEEDPYKDARDGGKSSSKSPSGKPDGSRMSQEGSLLPSPEGSPKEGKEKPGGKPGNKPSEGESEGKGSGSGSGEGSGKGSSEEAKQAELEMIRAAQKSLRAKAEDLSKTINGMNAKPGSDDEKSLKSAQQHMKESLQAMDELDKKLSEAYFNVGDPEKLAQEALEAYEKSRDSLKKAKSALDELIARSESKQTQRLLQAKAEAMAELAERAAELSEEELRDKLNTLSVMGHSGGSEYVRSFKGSGTPPLYITLVDSIVPPADKSNIQEFINDEPRLAAKWLAEQYFMLAIEANQERGALRQPPSSDSRYSAHENEFYERAAQFKGGKR